MLLNYLFSHTWDQFCCLSLIRWKIFSLNPIGHSTALDLGPLSPWNHVFLWGLWPFPPTSFYLASCSLGCFIAPLTSHLAFECGTSPRLLLFCAPWTMSSPPRRPNYHFYAMTPKFKSSFLTRVPDTEIQASAKYPHSVFQVQRARF